MKKALIYCRVSTEEQAQGGHSLDVQERALKRLAEEQGWTVLDTLRDEGYTATNTERPGLRRVRASITAGTVDYILGTEQDRIFRNEDDRREYERLATLAGVCFVFADEPLLERPHMRKLTRGLKGALAEFVSDQIGEKVGAVMRDMAGRGLWTGGRVPYGYRVEIAYQTDGGPERHLVEDAPTAAIVRQIFEWYVNERKGAHVIAGRLNEMLVPAPAVQCRRPDGSRIWVDAHPWKYLSVHKLLSSRLYLGERTYNKEWSKKLRRQLGNKPKPRDQWISVMDAQPALIDRKLWEDAQGIRDSNRSAASPRETYSDFKLTGFLTCGDCGSKMSGRTTSDARKGWTRDRHFYICNGRRSSGQCSAPMVRAERAHGAARRVVVEYLSQRDIIEDLTAEMLSLVRGNLTDLGREAKRLDTEIEAVRKGREALWHRLEQSTDPAAEAVYLPRIKEREASLAALTQTRAEMAEMSALADTCLLSRELVESYMASIGTIYETASGRLQRDILKLVASAMIYRADTGFEVRLQPPVTLGLDLSATLSGSGISTSRIADRCHVVPTECGGRALDSKGTPASRVLIIAKDDPRTWEPMPKRKAG